MERPQLAAGNFNGDDWIDLAYVDAKRNLFVKFGSENGNFSAPVMLMANAEPAQHYWFPSAGKYYNKQTDDIIFIGMHHNGASIAVKIFTLGPPGAFKLASETKVSNGPIYVQQKMIAPLPQGSVIFGRGELGITAISIKDANILSELIPSSRGHDASSGDLNGDGISDLVWAGRDGLLWYALGTKQSPSQWEKVSISLTNTPSLVTVGDFNGDNLDDVAVLTNAGPPRETKVHYMKSVCN
jgi:hypothetical protein